MTGSSCQRMVPIANSTAAFKSMPAVPMSNMGILICCTGMNMPCEMHMLYKHLVLMLMHKCVIELCTHYVNLTIYDELCCRVSVHPLCLGLRVLTLLLYCLPVTPAT